MHVPVLLILVTTLVDLMVMGSIFPIHVQMYR